TEGWVMAESETVEVRIRLPVRPGVGHDAETERVRRALQQGGVEGAEVAGPAAVTPTTPEERLSERGVVLLRDLEALVRRAGRRRRHTGVFALVMAALAAATVPSFVL